MDRAHGSVMPGIHGLQQFQHFAAAHFANDDAIGAHAQAVDQQIADADMAAAVKTARAAFQPDALRTIRDAYGARVRDRLDQASAAGSDTGAAR